MKVSYIRRLSQLASFIFLNAAILGVPLLPLLLPVYECPNQPTKTALCNLGILQRNLSFEWQVYPALPLASFAMFVVVGVILGSALCGWACPLGFFQDLLAFLPGFFKRKQKELSQRLHYTLTGAKYMILFITLAIVSSVGLTYIMNSLLGRRYSFSLGVCGQAPYCLVCPVPVLFVTLPSLVNTLLLGAPFPHLSLTSYIQLSALIFLLASSIVTKRFWCRYICPQGALMGLFNRISLLRIRKIQKKCTAFCRGHQKDCSKNCPMGIQVSRNQEPSASLDCILCYDCAESCSNKAVKSELG